MPQTRRDRPRPIIPAPLPALLLAAALATPPAALAQNAEAAADGWRIDREASVLALITHKAGIGAGLAHNHLVVAQGYDAELMLDGAAPAREPVFAVEIAVDRLAVDDAALQDRWYPRIAQLGILGEPFSELDEGDRNKIRKSMLGKKQLDAERHSTIKARLVALAEAPATIGEVAFSHAATIAITLHGVTAERSFAARWEEGDGGRLTLEATGPLTLSDFGIKPYSALLGAIRNDDRVDLYVRLVAVPADRETGGR